MTKKQLSRMHEDYVAKKLDGVRSPSSGASVRDKGDVRSHSSDNLIECKCTGEPGGKPKGGMIAKHMEKITDEAWEEGLQPVLALRYWRPDSPLANLDGWVDLTVRRLEDDAERRPQ